MEDTDSLKGIGAVVLVEIPAMRYFNCIDDEQREKPSYMGSQIIQKLSAGMYSFEAPLRYCPNSLTNLLIITREPKV